MDCISLVDIASERQPENLPTNEYEKQKNHYSDRYKFHKEKEL
jgi:electron transport complex protein RnfB